MHFHSFSKAGEETVTTRDVLVPYPPSHSLTGLYEARRLPEQVETDLWEKNSCDVEDFGHGVMDGVFLRSLDEPDELWQWLCSIPSVTALSFYSCVGCCEMVMNSECLGQYDAAWVMTERLSTVTQWLSACYSHLCFYHPAGQCVVMFCEWEGNHKRGRL